MRPCASTTSSRASGGRWTARFAAIIRGTPRSTLRLVSGDQPRWARAAPPQSRQRSRARQLGPLEGRRIGIRNGQRVQRRVHVARIERQEANPFGRELLVPDAAHVAERGFARAVRAPLRIRVDRGVARDVEHDASAPFAGRRGQRTQQRFGQPERAEHVGGQRQLEVLARRVAEQRQRHRSQARGVVDEHVETAKGAGDLQSDRIDVFLPRDVADDAVRARMCQGDGLDVRGCACDEGHVRAAAEEFAARARGPDQTSRP